MKQIEANKNRAERLAVLQKIFSGEISLHQASIELGISYSQTKRIYALYKREGQKSLVHKNVGKRSNHRISDSIRETAVRLFKEKYYDF
nr:hypothetical protein [Candidatus Omnitrophota bacterium]